MIRAWRWRRPRVSVLIASYHWPEALRLSLASALAQTVEDIEVLVIEDGPDGASRAVVREAGDRRIRWMRLNEGTGSQAGPNSRGCAAAKAPIVAYLGHDDIWHPEHLARLVATLGPELDAVHSITLYLRPDADTAVWMSGGAPWCPEMFVAPSSLAHWRNTPRIGHWASPDSTGRPVDYAFLMRSHQRGARFATTGAPTAFKLPAAWHLDCYRTRDAGPQRRLTERLTADPNLGNEMLAAARAAGVAVSLPAPPPEPPGVIADYNRRLKGLPARFGPPLRSWRPDPNLTFPGWHPVEQTATGRFAWTGPEDRAVVRLDAPTGAELGVRVVVRQVPTGEHLDRLVVDLDGMPVAIDKTHLPDRTIVLTGWHGRGAERETVEVGLTAAMFHPRDLYPESSDPRRLGVAVSEIELLSRGSTDAL